MEQPKLSQPYRALPRALPMGTAASSIKSAIVLLVAPGLTFLTVPSTCSRKVGAILTSGTPSQLLPPPPPFAAGVALPLLGPEPSFPSSLAFSFSFRFSCRLSTSFFAANGSALHSQARCSGAVAFSAVRVVQYGRILGGSVIAMGKCEQN